MDCSSCSDFCGEDGFLRDPVVASFRFFKVMFVLLRDGDTVRALKQHVVNDEDKALLRGATVQSKYLSTGRFYAAISFQDQRL